MKLSIRDITMVSLFAALSIAAAVILRFGGAAFVPFSLMPLVAMLAGSLLRPGLAAMSLLVYIMLGLLGMPVFASPPYGGLTYILKPTFGFLPGFVVAAFVMGKILQAKDKPSFWGYLSASLVGLTIIYLVGLPYLYAVLNFYLGKSVSVMGVLKIGFLPYIALDIGKAVVAALIARPVAVQVRTAFIK